MIFSKAVSRFLFGSNCLVCGETEGGLDPWLCPSCRQLLARESEGVIASAEAFSLYAMGPVSRKLIHALKYGSMPGMASYLVRHAGSALEDLKEWLPHRKRLFFIPVPLHPSRFRERGYNQTEKIAAALASACGGRVLKILERNSFTVSQTKLSRAERALNVVGAFYVKKNVEFRLGDAFVVVDDVFTTGATTGSCLYALRRAGIQEVRVCTLLYERSQTAAADFAADSLADWDSFATF